MDIGSISSPLPTQSPQMRYASLHRAVEKGIASDPTWVELSLTCVELGLQDEAVKWFGRIENSQERFRVQNILIRHGMIVRPDNRLRQVTEADTRQGLVDDVQEAVHFLADGQMPLTVTVATATFPLAVGLGGYWTSNSPAGVAIVMALLPAVLVLMAVAAVARRVLIDSATGIEDAPSLPARAVLTREAIRASVEVLTAGAALLGPAFLLYLIGLPGTDIALALVVGMALLPMTLMLRVICGDWKSLQPHLLLPAVYRGGLAYAGRTAAALAMFVPALGCWYASGSAVAYLQLALVGPLVVAPMLISARLLGRFLHTHRSLFRGLMNIPDITGRITPGSTRARDSGLTRHRAQPARASSPAARNGRRRSRPTAARRPVPNTRPNAAPEPQQLEIPPSRLVPIGKNQAAKKNQPTVLAKSSPAYGHEPIPDILSMPGFKVVTGSDRVRAGASSHSKD